MSLANTIQLETLEYRVEQMRLAHQQQAQVISGLQSALANLQQGGFTGSGGGGIFIMAGVVIAAGASVTGATVDWVIGGTGIVANANATVWNMMQSATVSGNTIVLGANPDGSFTVISQSC